MKRKLILLTNSYPFGEGEKPFVSPEVEGLHGEYDITIASAASVEQFLDKESASVVPNDVEVVWCGRMHGLSILVNMVKMPFTRVGRHELRLIWSDRIPFHVKLGRAFVSACFFGVSNNLRAQIARAGLFNDAENALYYSFWFGACATALALEKVKHPGLTFISRVHGYDLYDHRMPFGRQPFQWLRDRECSMLVFVSQGAMDCYLEQANHRGHLDSRSEHYALSRLGAKSLSPLNDRVLPNDEKQVIMSCSNVIPLKRVEIIASAIAMIAQGRNISWVHFGDGADMSKIKNIVEVNNIDARLFGHVPHESVLGFMAAETIKCFITTSSTEGCPVSIMEAMSFGIPIIGTAVGGIPEQIDGNGILLDENPSVEEVATAIESILDASNEDYARMCTRSYELFNDRFNSDNNLKYFKQMIAKF